MQILSGMCHVRVGKTLFYDAWFLILFFSLCTACVCLGTLTGVGARYTTPFWYATGLGDRRHTRYTVTSLISPSTFVCTGLRISKGHPSDFMPTHHRTTWNPLRLTAFSRTTTVLGAWCSMMGQSGTRRTIPHGEHEAPSSSGPGAIFHVVYKLYLLTSEAIFFCFSASVVARISLGSRIIVHVHCFFELVARLAMSINIH